jgi:hypothetical protein
MEIKVIQLIKKEYLDKAASFTVNKEVHPGLWKMYNSEHSPIRTQTFWIELLDIFSFVSVHLVRHKHGVEHFVRSNREDRSSHTEDLGRKTLVNHAMMINAQGLINMARKRLCSKSHIETQKVMISIKEEINKIDPTLAQFMVPECEYRRGCHEFCSCGRYQE